MKRGYQPVELTALGPDAEAAKERAATYLRQMAGLFSEAFPTPEQPNQSQSATASNQDIAQSIQQYGGPQYDGNQDVRTMLARTLQAEAGNEGYQGMIDVGSVIQNRANAGGRYGQGIPGVILKNGQFSAWNSVTGYAGGEQGQNMNFTPNELAYKAADAILSGNYKDQTGGATHYVNYNVSQPSWFNQSFVRRGNHWFGNPDGPARNNLPSANSLAGFSMSKVN